MRRQEEKLFLEPARLGAGSNSASGTLDPAFLPSIWRVFSSVSTASIKRARGNPGAPGWDSPSPNISFWRMRERFAPRANLTTARLSCLPCPLPRPTPVNSSRWGHFPGSPLTDSDPQSHCTASTFKLDEQEMSESVISFVFNYLWTLKEFSWFLSGLKRVRGHDIDFWWSLSIYSPSDSSVRRFVMDVNFLSAVRSLPSLREEPE